MQISVVIPLFNESSVIDELYLRLKKALEKVFDNFEICFVDDGSTDHSLRLILEIRKSDKRVKVISLSRNFGHQAAYMAGMRQARGEYVVTMDGDLQDPPELIKTMYDKIVNGQLDIIQAVKRSRSEAIHKRILLNLFHVLYSKVSTHKGAEHTGNYAIYNRKALNALLHLNEKIMYIPGLRNYIGFRQGSVFYDRDKRYNGKAKMSFKKLFGLAADALFSSTKFPIRVCLILGLIGIVVLSGVGFYVVIAKIAGFALEGWPSTMLSLLFLGFIQLTFLGVLGEYVFRSYKESQNRPSYFIQDIYDDTTDTKSPIHQK